MNRNANLGNRYGCDVAAMTGFDLGSIRRCDERNDSDFLCIRLCDRSVRQVRVTGPCDRSAMSEALGNGRVPQGGTLNPVRCFKGSGTDAEMASLREPDTTPGVDCACLGNVSQALAFRGVCDPVQVNVFAAETARTVKKCNPWADSVLWLGRWGHRSRF